MPPAAVAETIEPLATDGTAGTRPPLRSVDGVGAGPQSSRWPDASGLTAELAACQDPVRDQALRRRLVEEFMPMATAIATRYRARGESLEDLVQAACLGLVKAARSFDPNRGSAFESYASVSITGEVKRHFRDHGWDLRPPRRVQELRPKVVAANEELSKSLGRAPRISEVAEQLGLEVEAVAEAMTAGQSYHLHSIDSPVEHDGGGQTTLAESLGQDDRELARVIDLMSLRSALAVLPDRLQYIVHLRYDEELTQADIGRQLGVTQMQVSRLLAKAHRLLRAALDDEAARR